MLLKFSYSNLTIMNSLLIKKLLIYISLGKFQELFSRISEDKSSLRINNIQEEDGGMYTVVIQTTLGFSILSNLQLHND